jgi:ribosomal-protein-alanine N-acetyltransferase
MRGSYDRIRGVPATPFPRRPDPPERIRTERLLLRRPRIADAEAVYLYAGDPEVVRFMDFRRHASVEDSLAFLRPCAARWDAWRDGEELFWVVTEPPSDLALGGVGARVRDADADFGYVLAREAWGRGVATEAARAVVAWLAALPGVERVWATCDAENLASARVLEKAGLALEAVLPCATTRPNLGGGPRDTRVYARRPVARP